QEKAMGGTGSDDARAELSLGGHVIAVRLFRNFPARQLRVAIDRLKSDDAADAFIVIASDEGKTAIAVGVKEAATDALDAVALLRPIVAAFGGKGGGGRPDLAQGGAPVDLTQAPKADV